MVFTMHRKRPFRAIMMGVGCGVSALLGVWAFALPLNQFPKGTENCNVFTRGTGSDQNACVLCCAGTEATYKANVPACISLCKKLSALKPGQKPYVLDANLRLVRQPPTPSTSGPPAAAGRATSKLSAKHTKPTKKAVKKNQTDDVTGKTP